MLVYRYCVDIVLVYRYCVDILQILCRYPPGVCLLDPLLHVLGLCARGEEPELGHVAGLVHRAIVVTDISCNREKYLLERAIITNNLSLQ